MTKFYLLLLFSFFLNVDASSQLWFAKNANIKFFSATPIENIEATNKYASAAINAKSGKIYFKAVMTSFKFEKALMEEHFNENYIESEKFPNSDFSGFIESVPDLTKEGVYTVKIKGTLTLHGVAVARDITATLKVEKGKITASSKFKVKCSAHAIKIPSVVKKNINDDIEVTISAVFLPK